MGGYPPHVLGPGGVPVPGGEATDEEDLTAEARRKVGVNLDIGGGSEVGVLDNGDLHSAKSKYGCTVYCDAINYGPMKGSGEEAGDTGEDAVAGTGGN